MPVAPASVLIERAYAREFVRLSVRQFPGAHGRTERVILAAMSLRYRRVVAACTAFVNKDGDPQPVHDAMAAWLQVSDIAGSVLSHDGVVCMEALAVELDSVLPMIAPYAD